MEYYYSGTESWWCGNWNNLVCRRLKCKVDNPFKSTVVNLGRKQKWCSLWCLWSQVQQDTSGPDNFRILGCLWTIHHRCTCKWDRTEMLNVSFPLRAKTVWNPLRMNTERCRREQRLYEYGTRQFRDVVRLQYYGKIWHPSCRCCNVKVR